MTADAFLNAVQNIVQSAPVYREGGTGADGTCDCIGLVMGAMYACGQAAYDLHSSNYFARFQTDGLEALDTEDQLQPGMIVFKARSGADTLHERYQPGGRCFNGDLLDYYHAGVVESVQPLSIVHCTSSNNANGIAFDDSIRGWTHCGSISGLAKAQPSGCSAVVTAPSGKTVNLRRRPDKAAPVLCRVPIGSVVTVSESAQGWARVTADGVTGYMMESFLERGNQQEQWVRLPLQSVLDIIETLKAFALTKTKEELL